MHLLAITMFLMAVHGVFFFCVLRYISGVHHFRGSGVERGGGRGGGGGRDFAYVTVFNPTIEVVTFCLRGCFGSYFLCS